MKLGDLFAEKKVTQNRLSMPDRIIMVITMAKLIDMGKSVREINKVIKEVFREELSDKSESVKAQLLGRLRKEAESLVGKLEEYELRIVSK